MFCAFLFFSTLFSPDPEAPRTWHWVKKDLPEHVAPSNSLHPQGPALQCKTPLQMFVAHLDHEILQYLLLETNRHRLALGRNNMEAVHLEELVVFLGISCYMSIVDLPSRRMYWSPGTRQPVVAEAMTVNRFEAILSVIHMNDNVLMKERGERGFDILFKIRPLIEKLNLNFSKCALPEKCIAVDEQIIPFKGRHSLKVYMMKKPKKWGYKVWVQAGQSGYVHNFVFAGDNALLANGDPPPGVGKAGNIVLHLTRDQPENSYIYFDNYFASPDLLAVLRSKNQNATGTIRANRTRNCPLLCMKDLKKKGRGSCDYRIDEDNSVLLCEWFDNKVVTVASNTFGVNPTHVVKRYDRKTKSHTHIPCPALIKSYNENMGGVDKCDMLLALYRNTMKSKKWYKRVFFHLLDLSVTNSWLLYKAGKEECTMQLAQFKLDVARGLISAKLFVDRPIAPPTGTVLSGSAKSVNDDMRLDQYGHFGKKMNVPYAQRCKLKGCTRKTKHFCRKCKVYLCIDSKGDDEDCFYLFHNNA